MVTAAIELRHEDGGSGLKYPDEAIVFEGVTINAGDILEFVGFPETLEENENLPAFCAAFNGEVSQYLDLRNVTSGGYFGYWRPSEVKPLTPAAEEVLAIARERSGS
jgi:hypothetical protein